ncbi:MAG: hypothetical protein E6J91_52925 [Deltaproteobacteria bacterium]|nr:MAG: hypothetical protein E6J91_52925 [Deltaproteobacteria bacterium]
MTAAMADPPVAVDLVVSLFKLGAATSNRILLHEALQIARGLEQTGRLAPSDHQMLDVITQTIDAIP